MNSATSQQWNLKMSLFKLYYSCSWIVGEIETLFPRTYVQCFIIHSACYLPLKEKLVKLGGSDKVTISEPNEHWLTIIYSIVVGGAREHNSQRMSQPNSQTSSILLRKEVEKWGR